MIIFFFLITKIDNPAEVVIDIKVLQRKTLTNSRRNNNDSKRSNILRKIFKEEYTFDSQHDTFKLFFIYNQKPPPGLVYIRIDNPDDSANLPGHREITKFYKEERQRGVKPHFQEHRARTR
jgi:hypothetical protein